MSKIKKLALKLRSIWEGIESDELQNIFNANDNIQSDKIFTQLYPVHDIRSCKGFMVFNYATYYDYVTHHEILNSTSGFTTLLYADKMEEKNSKLNLEKTGTFDEENNVTYTVDNLGLRVSPNSPPLKENLDYMTFGCSYTYGTGVPIKDTWPQIFFDKLNCKGRNMGYNGSSITKIIRFILNIVPYYKPKNLIILLPHYSREEVIYEDSNKIKIINYVPGFLKTTADDIFNYETQRFNDSLNFVDRKANTIKNLFLLKYFLQANNIKGYVASWDKHTHYLIERVFPSSRVLKEPLSYDINDKTPGTIARDGSHPGIIPHRNFGEYCYKFISPSMI